MFGALYGKLIPLDVNAKVEEKKVVRYETVEERRAAMIAKGWSPTVLAAMEEAMEPKFLRDNNPSFAAMLGWVMPLDDSVARRQGKPSLPFAYG